MSDVQGQSLIIMMMITEEQMTDCKKSKKNEIGKRTMDNSSVCPCNPHLDKITTCCSAAVGVKTAFDRNLHFLSSKRLYMCVCAENVFPRIKGIFCPTSLFFSNIYLIRNWDVSRLYMMFKRNKNHEKVNSDHVKHQKY